MARLLVKNGHHENTCYDEIGLSVWNKDTILHAIKKVYVIFYKRKEIFTMVYYNFCISTLILILEMTTFVI